MSHNKRIAMAASDEVARLQVAVTSDPTDWASWTGLLAAADKAESIAAVRLAYNSFLARFPYCFGYWKKFAEHEVKAEASTESDAVSAALDRALRVYTRGTEAVPHSPEMWTAYFAFLNLHKELLPDADVRRYVPPSP